MYCLSEDRLKLIDANNFVISKVDDRYVIIANYVHVMATCDTLDDAKSKLLSVSLSIGADRRRHIFCE